MRVGNQDTTDFYRYVRTASARRMMTRELFAIYWLSMLMFRNRGQKKIHSTEKNVKYTEGQRVKRAGRCSVRVKYSFGSHTIKSGNLVA